MPKLRSVRLSKRESQVAMILVIILFVAIGYIIARSRAATPASSVEVGASAVSPATTAADTTASAGNVVNFKAASSGGGTYYVIGSGDIAKSAAGSKPTGDQILNLSPAASAIFTFGDNAYDAGTTSEFASNYDPSWGYKSDPVKGPKMWGNTYPSPGNHEYDTSGATGYYAYYNATATTITGHTVDGRPDRGYYAWNLGSNWRFYSLNSEANTAEANTWLNTDLTANARQCVVAYWHTPAFTSPSHHGASSSAKTYFTTLYNHNAEIVFVGHNHVYERFKPIDPSGNVDTARGILDLTVGTGGAGQSGYEITSPLPTSVVHNSGTYGNILLTAKDNGTFQVDFLRASGNAFTDSTTGTCH